MNILSTLILSFIFSCPVLAMEQAQDIKAYLTEKKARFDALCKKENPNFEERCEIIGIVYQTYNEIKTLTYKRMKEADVHLTKAQRSIYGADETMNMNNELKDSVGRLCALMCLMEPRGYYPGTFLLDEKDILPFTECCLEDAMKFNDVWIDEACRFAYINGLVETVRLFVAKKPELKNDVKRFTPMPLKYPELNDSPELLSRAIAMVKLEKELQVLTPDRIKQLEEWYGKVGVNLREHIEFE